jgi:hypothetical protein
VTGALDKGELKVCTIADPRQNLEIEELDLI